MWTAAALAVLRDAEMDLAGEEPLAAPFRAAAEELRRTTKLDARGSFPTNR